MFSGLLWFLLLLEIFLVYNYFKYILLILNIDFKMGLNSKNDNRLLGN